MLRNRERTEIEKTQQRQPERRPLVQRDVAHKSPKSSNAIVRYFQETGDELRKVAWPTREQTIRLTVIVLTSTLAATIFLGLMDEIFRRLSSLLVNTG